MAQKILFSTLCISSLLTMPDFSSVFLAGLHLGQDVPEGRTIKKKLPDDLPQEKILFVSYSPVVLPAEVPRLFTPARGRYSLMKNHNEVIPESNEQLAKASAKYPFAHRTTTLDSVSYYKERGYKYMLMQSSFNATIDGTYKGTRGSGMGANRTSSPTTVNLYVQNLQNGDKYVFNDFSETFTYYYKGQVGMLLKQVSKQFNIKS